MDIKTELRMLGGQLVIALTNLLWFDIALIDLEYGLDCIYYNKADNVGLLFVDIFINLKNVTM